MMLAPVTPEVTVETANRKFRSVGRYIDILLVRRSVDFVGHPPFRHERDFN